MSKLSPVSWRELVKRLRRLGLDGPFPGGRHPYMVREDLVLYIPHPHRDDISVDLLFRILEQAGISREEWLKAK
jgi:predicted RNA binding protein YcfA (HicA-like mRNA interferase family)